MCEKKEKIKKVRWEFKIKRKFFKNKENLRRVLKSKGTFKRTVFIDESMHQVGGSMLDSSFNGGHVLDDAVSKAGYVGSRQIDDILSFHRLLVINVAVREQKLQHDGSNSFASICEGSDPHEHRYKRPRRSSFFLKKIWKSMSKLPFWDEI